MQAMLDRGVDVVLWLQRFHPVLDLPFIGLSLLGQEALYVLLPVLYWGFNRRTGARLALLFLLSAWANALAKLLANQPRPFQYDPRVLQLSAATGGGFPSGHTQGAVVVWGYLAARRRRWWLWVLAGLLILLIPLSRVYLGLHFPVDLLGGYVIGAALLLPYLGLEPAAEAWLDRKGLWWQLGLALCVSALLAIGSGAADKAAAVQAVDSPEMIVAFLAGIAIGLVLERRWVRFEPAGSWAKRVLCVLLGVALMLVLRGGLQAVLGSDPLPGAGFATAVLLGLFAAGGAPWLFVRLRLARSAE